MFNTPLVVLAIIPARGGSKGIPRKNVLPLAGKPLIGWTIEAALASRHVNRVVVSTDDAEIAAVTKKLGAETLWRPADISGDLSSSESALLNVLEQLERDESYVPDIVVFLQCTSPLTAPEDIDGTIEKMLTEEADTALAVMDFHYFVWGQNKAGDLLGINHDKRIRQMRQEREPQYLETGAVYAMRTKGFLSQKHRFFGKTAFHVIPPERRMEIDEPVDLKIAETLLYERMRKDQESRLPNNISALIFDFDGVMTDNRVWLKQDGEESVACARSDGMGLSRIRDLGFPIIVLSTEKNPVVSARCLKLNIECHHGIDDKLACMKNIITHKNLTREGVIFVGNDINDLGCLKYAGCSVIVSDAHESVRAVADIVLSRPGGKGAVRELCDLILRKTS